MLGLIETTLFLIPIAVYVIWRVSAADGGPSARWLIAGAGAVAVLAASLFWFTTQNRLDISAVYVPPQMHDGQLVPAHTVPR